MGIDAYIFFKLRDGAEVPKICLPPGVDIVVADIGREIDATHEVDIAYRYWSPDYPRGPWPALAMILMSLLTDTDVEKVWYLNDSVGWDATSRPFTPLELLAFTAAYLTLEGQ